MAPLRIVVFDRTCRGVRKLGLTEWWTLGTRLYAGLGRIDASFGVASWTQALDRVLDFSRGARIAEIQYWGHGNWGRVRCGADVLDATSLVPDAPLASRLDVLRERMLRGREGLFWLRTCESYGTADGKRFARALTDRLDCRTAGHTYVIHAIQSGLHSLVPGDDPRWSAKEGLTVLGVAQKHALPSTFRAPNTITCFHGAIPAGY